MYSFIVRRLLLSLPTLFIVSFLVFMMVRLDPDSVVAARLGEGYTPEAAEAIKEDYGLNNPVWSEYVKWLGNILTGDWGQSAYTFEPVLSEMAPKIAVTLELAVLAVLFSLFIGVPIGVFSAMRQDRWPDYTLRVFAIFGLSVPGFLVATVLLTILAEQSGWIPDTQYTSLLENPFVNLKNMWLPAFLLSLASAAQVMRFSRTMMLDVLRQDYIRTAWAKGLRERVIIARHALRNALLPVVTVLGLTLAFLVGGTVVFETLFTLPGLGTHLIRAVQQKDFAVVQGVTLFFAIAVIVINLMVDIAYTVLDPRARIRVMAEAVALPQVGHTERPAPGFFGRLWGFFMTLARRKPLGFAGLIIILIMVILGLFPAFFATHEPADAFATPFQERCLGPQGSFLCPTKTHTDFITGETEVVSGSLSEPFGTDQLGRDIYSRIIYGARWAIYIGVVSVGISTVLGLLVGVTSGYFGGKFDSVIQRLVDALLALPVLVVLLALPTLIGGMDLDGPLPFDEPRITFFKLALVLGVLGAAGGSRVIRSAVIGVRSSQYLEAARVIGATDGRIMLRHVIPNIFGPLMVQATISLGGVILAEAALSFLGFGVSDPDTPTWGQMLDLARRFTSVEPWGILWPGVAIALAVFSFNMLGDALRDLLDPRLRGARGSFG